MSSLFRQKIQFRGRIPTKTDDGTDSQKTVKVLRSKRLASVLASLSLSWLLHVPEFLSSVQECRSCVRHLADSE